MNLEVRINLPTETLTKLPISLCGDSHHVPTDGAHPPSPCSIEKYMHNDNLTSTELYRQQLSILHRQPSPPLSAPRRLLYASLPLSFQPYMRLFFVPSTLYFHTRTTTDSSSCFIKYAGL